MPTLNPDDLEKTELLHEIRRVRESMNFVLTYEEIDAAKKEGRDDEWIIREHHKSAQTNLHEQ